MSASTLANALNIHMGEARQIKKMADAFRDRLKGAHGKAEEFMRSRQIELKRLQMTPGLVSMI